MKKFRLILVLLLLTGLACNFTKYAGNVRQEPAPVQTIAPGVELTALPVLVSTGAAEVSNTLTVATAALLPPTTPTIATAALLPPATPTVATAALLPPATPTVTPDPVETKRQLGIHQELWKTVQENYLYEDFNGLNWEQVGQEYRARIESGLSTPDFYLAMKEMVRRLGDEHSRYMDPAETKEEDKRFEGGVQVAGIGVWSRVIKAHRTLVVVQVAAGGPAYEAGIREHDVLLAAGGQPLVDEAGEANSHHLLRGPDGTTVDITVQSLGQPPRTVTVTRRIFLQQVQVPYRLYTTAGGKRIGYILLVTFQDGAVGERAGEALKALAADGPLDGLIIDNRVNGGGVWESLRDTLRYFVSGTIGYEVTRTYKDPWAVRGKKINGISDLPLVILVGPETISAGEIMAGTLKNMRGAYLIGETTDGNVEVLFRYDLRDGSRAWIASAIFSPAMHPDQNWEETGITADEVVPTFWDEVSPENDPAIDAALRYFDGR